MNNSHGAQSQRLLVDPAEAARLLAVSPRTLHTLKATGRIPHVRIGALVRYDMSDLESFVRARKREGNR